MQRYAICGFMEPEDEGISVLYRDAQAALAAKDARIKELEAQLVSAKDLIQKSQDLASMRGEMIHAMTEKWAVRRRYHKTQFKAVVALKDDLKQQLSALTQELERVKLERDGWHRIADGHLNTINKKQADIDELKQAHADLLKAVELYKQASYQSHTGHWDETMQHGAGCPECIRARDLREQAQAFLRTQEPVTKQAHADLLVEAKWAMTLVRDIEEAWKQDFDSTDFDGVVPILRRDDRTQEGTHE